MASRSFIGDEFNNGHFVFRILLLGPGVRILCLPLIDPRWGHASLLHEYLSGPVSLSTPYGAMLLWWNRYSEYGITFEYKNPATPHNSCPLSTDLVPHFYNLLRYSTRLNYKHGRSEYRPPRDAGRGLSSQWSSCRVVSCPSI